MKKPTQRYCRDQQRDREMLSVNLREGLPWSQGKSTSRLSHQETLKTASQPLSSGALQSLPVCKGIPPSVNGSQLFYRRVSQTSTYDHFSILDEPWAALSCEKCALATALQLPSCIFQEKEPPVGHQLQFEVLTYEKDMNNHFCTP